MDCGPVLWVASPQHGHLTHTLSLISIPISFCSWLDFLVAPRTWLTMPGAVNGPQVQPCYAKSPSLARLCLLSFPKLLKKIPLCYLIPTSSASGSAPRANGVSHDFIRERKKERRSRITSCWATGTGDASGWGRVRRAKQWAITWGYPLQHEIASLNFNIKIAGRIFSMNAGTS